jgi:putative transposase
LGNFSWQQGYGAFAVSVSHFPGTINYIHHEAEHHRTRTFREEYLAILQKHNLQFEGQISLELKRASTVPLGRIAFLWPYRR